MNTKKDYLLNNYCFFPEYIKYHPDKYVISLWVKYAKQGDPASQYMLGEYLIDTDGDEQMYRKGMMWLRKAAAQGHYGAQNKLDRIWSAQQDKVHTMRLPAFGDNMPPNCFFQYIFIPKLIKAVEKGMPARELANAEKLKEAATRWVEAMGEAIDLEGFSVETYDGKVSVSPYEKARFIAFTFPAASVPPEKLVPPEAKYGVIDLRTMKYYTFESNCKRGSWTIGSVGLKRHLFMGFYADMSIEEFIEAVHPDKCTNLFANFERESEEETWKDKLTAILLCIALCVFILLIPPIWASVRLYQLYKRIFH